MKTFESNSRFKWVNDLLNAWPLCIDADSVRPLAALALDNQGAYVPGKRSLFYNGFVFVRLTLPAGLWLHVKPARDLRVQLGVGWKLNGRFGLLCRAQSDASAARGTHGPNTGQAAGWDRGTA